MPQLIATENGLIALSFFAIAAMVFLGVFRDRALGINPLAIATGFIFFTCASGHAIHAEHFLLDPAVYNADPDLWHLGVFDALTLAAGVGYLAQRRRYGMVIRGSTPMLDYQERLQMAEALRDIGQDIAAQTDFDKLLKRVVMHARDLLCADYAAIVTVDESGKLRRQVAGVDADAWSDDAWNEATFLTDSSGKVTAMSTSGRPVVIEDLLSVSAAGWSERTIHRALGGRSVLAVPICRGEKVSGGLMVAYHTKRRPTTNDLSSAAALASQAAVAIEKARLIESLRQADRLKDEFLSAAAHEMKTPVTAIKGWSEILMRGTKGTVDEKKALETIHRGAERIARLSEDLVTVMSLRPDIFNLERSRFDLTGAVRQELERERKTGNHGEVKITSGSPILVDADRKLVSEVIGRLIENALTYSPVSQPVEVRVSRNGNEATVAVDDGGTGIPVDRRPHIFEAFYEPIPAGSEGYVGTVSLGLYLSKRIVQSHGGRIWFEPSSRGGSVFSFSLPLAEKSEL